ncbi:hypothetical protein TCAL_14634 [Tigriopus californicus]|uniref:Uncharacterized protein n=1 Tax=Tigriopus californicus TaxID=6832 RepID=A0A553P8M2_TIGCA|nr:hypothetical protein TCAL_14634 [Tigriopus californicus]
MNMKKPSGKLSAVTTAQRRLEQMLEKPEVPLDQIRKTFERFCKLLCELEKEWQDVVPENEDEQKEWVVWGKEHVEGKAVLKQNFENMLQKLEKEALELSRKLEAEERKLAQRREDLELELELKQEQIRADEYSRMEQGLKEVQVNGEARSPNPPRSVENDPDTTSMAKILENVLGAQVEASLPRRALRVFDGKLTEYRTFMRSFRFQIEKKSKSPEDRLQYLLQYTAGQAYELISPCIYMSPSDGFDKAKELLELEYGSKFGITNAYRKDLEEWPAMKEEPEKMKKFSILLSRSATAMTELGNETSLSDPDFLVKIVSKLPNSCQAKWRHKVMSIEQDLGQEVNFHDLANFIRTVAKKLRRGGMFLGGDASVALNTGTLFEHAVSEERVPPVTKDIPQFCISLGTPDQMVYLMTLS